MWDIWKGFTCGLCYVRYTEPHGCKGFHLRDFFLMCISPPAPFIFLNGASKNLQYLCIKTTNYIMNFKLSPLNFQQLIVCFQSKAK